MSKGIPSNAPVLRNLVCGAHDAGSSLGPLPLLFTTASGRRVIPKLRKPAQKIASSISAPGVRSSALTFALGGIEVREKPDLVGECAFWLRVVPFSCLGFLVSRLFAFLSLTHG